MQKTSDRATKVLNELNKLDQLSLSSVNTLLRTRHQYNSDLIQQQMSYIANAYTKMYRLLSEEMFEEYEEREQFDNIVFDGLSDRVSKVFHFNLTKKITI